MARITLRRPGERADLSVPRGSPQMGARYDADAFGRFAEALARFLGTGRFIVGQTVIVIGWIILNTLGLINHWDPYPFILLNLAFSTQAAYAAPLILLAGNRAATHDRMTLEHAATQSDVEEKQNERLITSARQSVQHLTELAERTLAIEDAI